LNRCAEVTSDAVKYGCNPVGAVTAHLLHEDSEVYIFVVQKKIKSGVINDCQSDF